MAALIYLDEMKNAEMAMNETPAPRFVTLLTHYSR